MGWRSILLCVLLAWIVILAVFLLWPFLKRGEVAYMQLSSGIPPYPGRQPKSKEGFERLFASSGIFIHVLDPLWISRLVTQDLSDFTLDADCDMNYNCGAYSFLQNELPLIMFSLLNFRGQFAIAYDAEPLWKWVQCMSVFDANTKNRNCCTCAEDDNCVDRTLSLSTQSESPENRFLPTFYCANRVKGDGLVKCDSSNCRALNAGCGRNLWTVVFGNECSVDEIKSGDCGVCKTPQWCAEEEVRTPEAWVEKFAQKGGHGTQCRFKPQDRDLWFAAMKAFYKALKTKGLPEDFVTLENEVNFYLNSSEDDYKILHASFVECMMALIYMPNNVDEGKRVDPNLLGQIRRLQGHLSSQNETIPILQLNVEQPLSLEHWMPGGTLDLSDDYFQLTQI
jgi:hypothetical protein